MISIEWSQVNQAWFVLWNDQLLRVFTSLAEARDFCDYLENKGVKS